MSRRKHLDHRPIVAGLRALPGQWGRVGNYWWAESAKHAVRDIQLGRTPSYQPAGAFEAEIRIGADGDPIVYARYVGNGEVAA
ncbi:hypothetical protein RMN57_12985 [Kitasatospora sp. CM 4170]|uniref:Uncharacterized protein n=1 Tax=Kitasatospora aburaviensis TaxID=67265 RepID=A0ABW1F401_9ACTN|nr:hypothetical protein [Kitasatospora sp. CM 4170]WNM45568.1 hypothetical protein RMN57_12985 [Kitasatospora sp. CM 4170]